MTTKPSEPDRVDAYMKRLKHPLTNVVEALRRIILKTERTIGEEIKWNAPTFFYTGELPPFDPKEYKRYLVVFNLYRKDCIRLVFWRGGKVNDTSGFLEGDYKDGRRLASFSGLQDVTAKRSKLQRVLKQQLKNLRVLLSVALAGFGLVGRPVDAQQHHQTYVIVHGAWGGGWDWRAVDSMLTLRGHRVVRVTLTGSGERVHLASPEIRLSTHVADVVNTILWEDLHDVVLVGHSYGGMVITGVADRIPDRIHRLVYIDAMLPDSGESMMKLTGNSGFLQSTLRSGMSVPPWVTDTTALPRDVPQSFRTFTDTLNLVNPAGRRVPGTYILTVEAAVQPDPFQWAADRATARKWPVYKLDANHTPERSAREPLVAMLDSVP